MELSRRDALKIALAAPLAGAAASRPRVRRIYCTVPDRLLYGTLFPAVGTVGRLYWEDWLVTGLDVPHRFHELHMSDCVITLTKFSGDRRLYRGLDLTLLVATTSGALA